MDKVNKQELRRLALDIASRPCQVECTNVMTIEPAAILSLLDELERLERDNSSLRQDVRNAFDDDLKLATMRDQEAAIMKLEQYRKDAERYRWLRDQPEDSPYEHIGNLPGYMWDESIDDGMTKEGGANG